MKLADVTICWTPDRQQYPDGMRGKIRIFSATTPADHIKSFPCRAGRNDARAHDSRLERSEVYVLQITFLMHERDLLDLYYKNGAN